MVLYIVILVVNILAPVEEADALLGQWLTAEAEARVEIIKVDGEYEGSISWLKEPAYPEGDPECGSAVRDRKNPDPDKRNQPLMGSTMLKGFVYAGKNKWKNGTIYSAENGKTYKASLTLKEKDVLTVRGFVGISLLGRNTVWTRCKEIPEPEGEGPV